MGFQKTKAIGQLGLPSGFQFLREAVDLPAREPASSRLAMDRQIVQGPFANRLGEALGFADGLHGLGDASCGMEMLLMGQGEQHPLAVRSGQAAKIASVHVLP